MAWMFLPLNFWEGTLFLIRTAFFFPSLFCSTDGEFDGGGHDGCEACGGRSC